MNFDDPYDDEDKRTKFLRVQTRDYPDNRSEANVVAGGGRGWDALLFRVYRSRVKLRARGLISLLNYFN